MAQDLLRLRPDAIIVDSSGYLRVDYDLIDVKMSRLAPSKTHGNAGQAFSPES
jgi:hypothetical protein